MKISVIYFIFTLAMALLIPGQASSMQCVDLFDHSASKEILEQDEALGKIRIQHLLESSIKFIQTQITASSIRSTEAVKTQNRVELNRFLRNNQFGKAINIYRKIFDQVELSYHVITQGSVKLQVLESQTEPNSAEITTLKKRIRKHQALFAKHYGEYLSIRGYLEKIVLDTDGQPVDFVEAARNTLKYLGVHKFSEAHKEYASLKIPEQRVSIPEIKALYRSESIYTRLMLWYDFKSEVISVMKYILSSEVVIGTLNKIFDQFPAEKAEKLKRLSGILQSAKLRFRQVKVILDIESLPADPGLRLLELRRNNSATPNDELLVTYARTVEFVDSWADMMEYVRTKSAEGTNESLKANYKSFHDRMLIAQQKAHSMPDISVMVKEANIDHIIVIIQSALVFKVAGPSVFATVNDFYMFLASVIP